jgi:hypothetical protein
MNPISGRMFVGATLALSLGAFAFPVCAATGTSSTSPRADRSVSMQLAQAETEEHHELTDKAVGKANEVKSEVKGAAHAVRKAHRHHEATEGTHHTIGSKLDAKVDETKAEVKGAASAVKAEHEKHEAAEGVEPRD